MPRKRSAIQLSDIRIARSPLATDSTGLLTALAGDGRPLLALVALGLMLSGIFALFLSATGTFLPHDVSFLGIQPRALCDLNQCRIVHFIFHDRVSFGGTLLAIGTLYLWLLAFPLRLGEEWAWWTLLLSGTVGFLSIDAGNVEHLQDAKQELRRLSSLVGEILELKSRPTA